MLILSSFYLFFVFTFELVFILLRGLLLLIRTRKLKLFKYYMSLALNSYQKDVYALFLTHTIGKLYEKNIS